MMLHYLVKVKTPKMHVNTTSAYNVNFKNSCYMHQITLTVSLNIVVNHINERVQSVHHQHAHMTSDGHATGQSQHQ